MGARGGAGAGGGVAAAAALSLRVCAGGEKIKQVLNISANCGRKAPKKDDCEMYYSKGVVNLKTLHTIEHFKIVFTNN